MTGPDKELAREAIRRGAYQKVPELEPLVALVRERRPRTVVEIGSLNGGTLFAWCQVADPEAVIVSIDLPRGMFGGGYSWRDARRFRKYALPGQELHTLRRDSQDPKTVGRVEGLLAGRSIDFLLIDGDHSYDGVKRDWQLYEPLVAEGGLIAFHDILEHEAQPLCEVDQLWRELAPLHETAEFSDPDDDRGYGQWGGIGVIFKQPEPAQARSA
ncbi:MAG TPA: class I SAM-dependent methyltransferase [Solirubrobacterales bacterium]|nr:class I SAM-dependent methyltransferase [Solirubrobacterales bacterium]